jgi:hypothetical protein
VDPDLEAGVKVLYVGEMRVRRAGEDGGWRHGVFIEATPDELEQLAPHFEVLARRPVVIHVDKDAELAAIDAEED